MLLKKLNSHYLTLTAALIIFTIIKMLLIPFSTPLWWDEAWAYGRTVEHLIQHQINFLPNSSPDTISRGHPIILHSIIAFLASIFGKNVFTIHLSMFILNTFSIIAIWRLLTVFIEDYWSQLISLLIIILQPAFITQFGMLLSEVPLTGLFFFAIYYLIKEKYITCSLFLSISLLIKETGFLFVLPLNIIMVYKLINKESNNWRVVLITLLPLIVPGIYYLLQILLKGYLLFPEHTANTSLNGSEFLNKLSGFSAICFIYQGRNVVLLGLILALIYSLMKKGFKKLSYFPLLILIMFIYIVISSLNFFSPRYVLLPLTIFIFISIVTIKSFTVQNRFLYFTLITSVLISLSLNLIKKKGYNDISPSYAIAANLTKEFINRIESTDSLKGKVEYSFLLDNYRTSPILGYTEIPIKKEQKTFYKAYEINSSEIDLDSSLIVLKMKIPNYQCVLVKK